MFKCLKPSNYKPELGPLLKQRGETPAQFYRRMVKAAYTIRLGGEEHLNSYNWERPMSELEALDRQDEERQGEVDEGGPIEEQVNEREVQVTSEEEEEEKIRKQLTPGELITMHKDGRCTAKPVVQVMSTVVTDGKLVSMTLSDGEYVSANIIPEDESLGQQLISLEKFDLLKIHEASVYKSHLIIQNVEQLQMTREGRVVDIKKTVKADGVSGLRIMKKEALDLWGIRFSNMQKIEMGPAAAADDLSQTIMADDGVLERVGKKEEQPKEPSPPRVRSKRKMESCPFCVRSFTDKENLKEHMRSDHFDS